MALDPQFLSDPSSPLAKSLQPQAQQQEADLRLAEQVARQDQRQQEKQQRDLERQQQEQADAAKIQHNLGVEQQSVTTGRPTWTGADGVIRFKQSDQEWAAQQQKEQQSNATKLQFQQEGRKFTTAADGSVIPLESDAVLAQRRQDEGEALRRGSLDQVIKGLDAERDYATANQGLRQLPQTTKEKLQKELKDATYGGINALLPKLQDAAKATDKAGFWDVVNNNPTPEAKAAQDRVARLQQPDAGLDDTDLAALEADPATAATATKIRKLRSTLDQADAADKFHQGIEAKRSDLVLRRDNPALWEQKQREKINSLATPEDLASHIQATDADLSGKVSSFEAEAQALQAEADGWKRKADELAQRNTQARQAGIPAGELVTLSDGSTWHKPIAEELLKLQATQQAQAGDFEQRRRKLEIQQGELQRDLNLRNEAAQKLKATAQDQQKTQRDVLRFTPGYEGTAQALDTLEQDRAARLEQVRQTYGDTPAGQAAASAIEEDIKQRSEAAQAAGQQKAAAAAAAYMGIQTRLRENPELNKGSAGWDLWPTATKNLAQALGISEQEAGNLLEDQESQDWSSIQGKHQEQIPQGNALQRFLTEAAGDKRQFRILKNGGVIINPAITDPEAYRKAVEAAPATPEAKAAAMARQPNLRRNYGQQALETLNAIGDDKWKAFLAENKNLAPEEVAATYADKIKAGTGTGEKILRQVFQSMAQGIDDIGSQALGLLAGITGSETLMKGAQGLNERSALIEADKRLRGAGGNYALDTLGQFSRLVPSIIPAAGGARAASGALALFSRTALGTRVLPAISSALRAAKTPADAARAAQQMMQTTGIAGAGIAGGAQTYGAQVADIYTSLRKDHPEMDHSTALRQAQLPSLLSAGMTALLTIAGGATGVEKLITAPAAAKEAFRKAYASRLQQVGAIGKAAVLGGIKELPEEIGDELFSTVASAVATGQSVPEALAQFAESLPQLAGAIVALGGLGEGVQAAREGAVSQAAPITTPPEAMAAAEAEIDAYAPADLDEASRVQSQAIARSLLYIAQGDISSLPDADLALVGVLRGKDGTLENAPASADGKPPRVKIENGAPIITQPTLDSLAAEMPAVRAAIPLDEAARRAANNQISTSKPVSATAPGSASGEAGTTASASTTAPRGTSGNAPATPATTSGAGPAQGAPPATPAVGAPAAMQAAKDAVKSWFAGVRGRWVSDLFDGRIEASQAFNAVEQEGFHVQAHGMAKMDPTKALEALFEMFQNGLDPSRGRNGTLDTANLTNPNGQNGGMTAGGTAYRDGPFILVQRQGSQSGKGISSMDQVAAVLVNPALEAAIPAIQAALPGVKVLSYHNAADAISAAKAPSPVTNANTSPTPTASGPAMDEAASTRATELATHLTSLGLPADQAKTAAEAMVRRRGIIGASYLEHVTAPAFREDLKRMGISGALNAQQAQQNPLRAGADLNERAAQLAQEQGKQPDATPPATPPRNTTKEPAKSEVPRGTWNTDEFLAARQKAMSKVPVTERRKFMKFVNALDEIMTQFAPAFPAVRFTDSASRGLNYTGAGISIQTANGSPTSLDVNIQELFTNAQYLGEKDFPRFVRQAIKHEARHIGALKVIPEQAAVDLWGKLTPKLRNRIYSSYFAVDIHNAVAARDEKPKKLTERELLELTNAHLTGKGTLDLPKADPFHMAHEFLRMLDEDAEFAGQTSEAMDADPGLGEAILAFLRRVMDEIKRLIDTDLPADVRVQVNEMRKLVEGARKKLLAELPARDPTRKGSEPNLAQSKDGRRSVLAGDDEQGTPPAKADFRPAMGKDGTAYTDGNDAIDYAWAVVDVNSLVISNLDDGRINPDYPQELQPRDRTSAGSEAQVADIARNMNLDRLSASNGVGDGAPIIGEDAVVESGNGRSMGQRRAYAQDGKAASSYRDALMERAGDFGLTRAQVEAVQNPVLVRIRKTPVDRVAFVLAANVSTIAPKREIEQAKIDAGQIVPDLFTTFVPTEDGDIFTPANADFIRAFVSAIVPPAERPAIIDARGNLTQTGLRRVRNALFVHAYGSSPETLNALSRLTESIDATGGNITNALVAAAPRFAEQQGRIAAGALYPLSITEDIAWTVQKLQDLRNRGERVDDYLAQDGIPGIDDVPTPLQKSLLQFFESNKAAPRQLSAALARYANAIDAAGDPKQISLFGDEPRPTREELWRLASQDRETPLATATKATMSPVAALNVFRKLDGQRRTEGQQRAYDAARQSLGSALRLDQPRKVLRRLSASTKAVDPRIEAKFGADWAHGWDANGFPNMPVTLPDGHPLLEQTLNKKTAKLRADHPLVAEGMLPAETEIPRKALHQAIVAFFMRHATPLPEGAQPTIYAMGGGGGAGKSSILGILKKAGAVDTSNTVEINADDIKLLIPEYQEIVDAKDGRAAMTVHEESSRLSNNLMDRAIPPNGKARYNVIFDGTLSNGPKSLKLISRWKAAGLRVHLIGVTIDPKEAIIRAVLRGADSGRWVPASVLLQAHQDFNGAVKSYLPEVEAADIYDNTPPDAHAVAQKSGADAPVSIANQQLWSIIDRRSHESFDATNHSTGGASEGASAAGPDGQTALREIQSQGSDSQGQVTLPMGRRRATDDTGPDLFSFNSGLGLSDLLTPDQQDSKLQQAAKLDLFGGTPNATPRPRPAAPRPAQPARAPKPQGAAPAPADLGDLFAQPGLGAGAAAGDGGRPMDGFGGTRQPGGSGSSGNAAPTGGEAGGSGTNPGTAGNVEGGSGADMPGMPGDAGRADAESRPDVGSPDRNFEIPTDLESLAPATDRAKIQANIEAIRLLKTLEAERRNPTAEEKRVLASYTGWGAFKEAFNSKYEEDISEIWDKPNARRQYMPDWLKSWELNHRANHKLLKEAMTEDEFASASASTLNAHYTALPIIRSMWQMVERLGFKGGRALEPSAGAGHYIGTTPATIADATKWQAVELDELSARLLSKLYPEATVNELQPDQFRAVTGLGFERARIPNGSLDLIISNVPFHESGPSKKGFPKLNLHNFFFAHALDKVKPGGLVAFITSESTMQNNVRQREFISSKGDLVAAFRLPNNAFKANAGTEVTTDILIFRKPDGTPFRGKDWKNMVEIGRQTITLTQGKEQTAEQFRAEAERTGEIVGKEFWKGDKRALNVSAPIMVNEYFVNHPQHALGNHTLASTMYRAGGYALVAPEGFDVKQALDALIPTLPENVMGVQEAADNKDRRLAGRNNKPFSFKEEDGKIFEVQPDGSMEEAEWSTNPELVKTWRSWRRISDAVKQLVEAETSGDVSDDTLEQMRRALNVAYDSHILTHKPVSRRFSNQHKHLYSDPDYPLTAALEQEVITIDPKTGKKSYTYKKADIFKKRIGRPIVEPTTAANLSDALEKSLAWRGRVDPVFTGRLLGISPADFEERALRERSDLFRNPSSAMIETADDYLTGNVRVKLQQAEDAAQNDPRMQKNVDALRKAQPDRKEIARISPVLGARWVPAQVYNAFIKEVLQGNDTVEYIPAGNSWLIYGSGIYKTEEHGTERKGPGSLFKHALDMTEPMVWDGSGDTREFNPAATAAAKNALDKMRRAFIDFAKTSEAQVTLENEAGESKTIPVWEAVEDAFNESQNSYVTPRHTGDYLTFPGLNTDYVYTRTHRRAVIARFLSTRRGMMAHGVGSGKTFNQIILSFEMRRLGLAKKPMIVVQNATLGQFAKSFLKAYPTAKLLVPTKRDFEAANRRKLVAKIATGDWDAVLLPHSQFDLISNKPSAVKAYMDSQIDELLGIINSTKDKAKVRDLEGMIKRLKDRRQGMLDALAARQDTAIMWEDLGIDALIMDEAHNYKSLPIITRMGRVKGVPSSRNSQRAINFMLKCRDVQSRTGGKNIFLATGTPIKNSMAEAFIMMQFMAPDILEEFSIHNFDDFATAYGQTVTEAEMAWGGTPKMETRFAKFQNGPSLVTMIRTMFDVAFGNEKLGLDVPKVKGGEPEMVIVPATEAMDQFNAWTRSVNDAWQLATGEEKEKFTAVPIQTMAAGVAAALDPRLISPTLPDDPASKVNTAIRRVLDIYKAGTARKTTQIIFSDLRNKFSMDYLMPFTGHPFPDYGSDGSFDLYTDIKAKLVAAGVPEKEVHLMQSGMTDVQKSAVFDKVDSGEIRIIIGSTDLLGVGVNIQTRLKAVHHLAPPRDFTPAMMEQRNGRIIRQGNLHAEKVEGQPAWGQEVEILNYGTDGSMDSAIYGTLARKQRFITQLLSGEDIGDTFDDPTDPVAVNMAEMAARTLGDPDFIRRIELEREVKDLRTLAQAFTTELSGKKSRLARLATQIRTGPETIARLEQEAGRFEKMWTRTAPRPEGVKQETDITDKPVYEFGGQVVDTAAKDGSIMGKLDLHLLDVSKTTERRGKTYDIFTLTVNGTPLQVRVDLTIPGSPTGGAVVDARGDKIVSYSGAASLIQQLRKLPADLRSTSEFVRNETAAAKEQHEKLVAQLAQMGTEFPDADRLAALELEARQVDERIRAKVAPPPAPAAPAKDETADLPEMTPVPAGLMTFDVEQVIDRADIIGNKLFIQEQLDRKLYEAVNKALEAAGGRWNKKAKAHVFKGDPRPYLGLAPMPAQESTLAMASKVAYAIPHEQGQGLERYQLDRRTSGTTRILGSRVTAEQGSAIRDVHFARVLEGPLREGSAFARPKFDWDQPGESLASTLAAAFEVPILTAQQEQAIRALPSNDTGVESVVYLDKENGVIYKRLQDSKGKPSGGIWPYVGTTSLNALDWSFQPADNLRSIGVRLALLTDIGGTPTEIAAVGPEGHIYLKQPLSPNPTLAREESFIDNAGMAVSRGRSGLVPIPNGMLPQYAPRAFMVYVRNRPWLVFDLHPDNFIGDNQGNGRINDPVFGVLKNSTLAKVPGLASVVRQAKAEADRLQDRSNRLFMASKAVAPADLSPLAKLGWNHLDRAASAKLAALARWTNEKTDAAQIVAKWKAAPEARPFLDALRAIQGQFFPSSILPREVAAARREMDIKAAIGAQKGMDLVRALSGTPKFSDIAYPQEFAQNPMWRRRLYAAMTGEESMSALPPALQDLAKKLREMLLTIGREAVKQGRMSTDTFALLEESYMPHYYEEDVQKERSLFKRFRLGIRDIFAQRTTAWHIVDTQQQDKTGQPALVNWQPGKWRFRNKEHRDAFFEDFLLTQSLERLKANGNAYERGLTIADLRAPAKLNEHTRGRLDEIRRVLRQRFRREAPLTIEEQEKAGLIMDPVYSIARYSAQMIHDNSTAEFFNFVAAKPEWVSDVQVQGFTEIPDNPRFGRLAGKFVQQDIAGQLLEMTEAPTTALHIYDTILGWWKTGKTVLNPGTHVRNILGNLFFSQLAGTSVWNPGNLPFYRAAVKALRDGGGALQEAYEQGVLGADFVSAELRQQLRALLPDPDTITPDNDATPGRLMGIGKAIGQFVQTIIANPSHKAYDKIAALYQAEDEVFKLAAYLKAKAMLGDPAAAAAHVRQWFPYFDQGSSPTLKALGRTAMPFLGFYRESIRIFGEALKNRPLALATGLSIPSLITFLSAAVLGLDDDELEQVRRDMRGRAGKLLGPTPLGGQPMFSLLLPFRSGSGALQQFDISAIHPFVDFIGNRVETDASEDWWQQTLRSLVAAGPIGSLIYSQMTGRDAFADRTFVEDNMTGSEKLAARLDNAAKTLLPPLAPGGTGFQTLANAGERQTNKTLEIRDPGQAALRAVVGLDVRNATPDLYRIADDWRKANGLPTSEGMDFGSTPVSRARKALFAQLAQPEPNRTAIQNIKQRLREMGSPVETEQDINRLLFYRNPLMIIRGEDNQQRFRASLTGLERNALESALREFEIIKARAPAFLR